MVPGRCVPKLSTHEQNAEAVKRGVLPGRAAKIFYCREYTFLTFEPQNACFVSITGGRGAGDGGRGMGDGWMGGRGDGGRGLKQRR